MRRRRVFVGVALALMLVLAGCTGVEKSHGVTLHDTKTEVDADDGQAVWTWSADVDPPDGEEEYCDIKADITLYDESGEIVGNTTKVLKNVDTSETRRSVSYIGEPEEVNSIVNYEIEFSEPKC